MSCSNVCAEVRHGQGPKGCSRRKSPEKNRSSATSAPVSAEHYKMLGQLFAGCQKPPKRKGTGLPPRTVDENLPAGAEDMGLIPGPGRFHRLQDK